MSRAETVERRVLGALRFVDAVTGTRVLAALSVTPPAGVRGTRNLSGLWVITGTPALAAVTADAAVPPFDPGDAAPHVFAVEDPSGGYLPRQVVVDLPRDPDPANQDDAGSLYRPVDVRMFPAPAARTSPNWAVVRATVEGDAPGTTRPGALVRVRTVPDGDVLARALADGRGEALVAVPGIPVTTWDGGGGGAVLTSEVDVDLEVVWDPDADGLPDPDALERRADELVASTTRVTLAAGRVLVQRL